MIDYPDGYQPGPICGVLSTAICAGVSFYAAHAWFKARKGAKWKGSTTVSVRDEALKHFGVKFETKRWTRPRPTVKTFAAKHAAKGATYMLRVRGHVVTLRNGWVLDQHERAVACLHDRRNCIVTHSTRIL